MKFCFIFPWFPAFLQTTWKIDTVAENTWQGSLCELRDFYLANLCQVLQCSFYSIISFNVKHATVLYITFLLPYTTITLSSADRSSQLCWWFNWGDMFVLSGLCWTPSKGLIHKTIFVGVTLSVPVYRYCWLATHSWKIRLVVMHHDSVVDSRDILPTDALAHGHLKLYMAFCLAICIYAINDIRVWERLRKYCSFCPLIY